MKTGKLMKLAPLVMAFAILVPIGAMAADNPGVYSGKDYSTLSGSTVTWDEHIDQYLSSVEVGATFKFHNEFHNANDDLVHPILIVFANGGTDTFNLPNLGPYSYTSNFEYQTSNAKAGDLYRSLQVTHQYNSEGPSITNRDQSYFGVYV